MFENRIENVIKNAMKTKKKTAFLLFGYCGMATIRVDPFLATNEEYEDKGIFFDSAEEDGMTSPPSKKRDFFVCSLIVWVQDIPEIL